MRFRRTYTEEFKREAVRMVTGQGLSVLEAARRLGIHSTMLQKWKKSVEGSSKPALPAAASTALEEENRRLRAENDRLRMEREILPLDLSTFIGSAVGLSLCSRPPRSRLPLFLAYPADVINHA